MSTLHVELLTKARELIETKDSEFLCIAITRASKFLGYGKDFGHCLQLKAKIKELLLGHGTLDSWLIDNCYESYDFYVSDFAAYERKARETRLAWIDWLIEEWRDAP